MRGKLLKCSAEQVRVATEEEHLGAALVQDLARDMLSRVRRGGRGYVDVTAEGAPPEDADEMLPPGLGPILAPDLDEPMGGLAPIPEDEVAPEVPLVPGGRPSP